MKNIKTIFSCLILVASNAFSQDTNIDLRTFNNDTQRINPEFLMYAQERADRFRSMRNVGIALGVSGAAVAATGVSLGAKFYNESHRVVDNLDWHSTREEAFAARKRSDDLIKKSTMWYSIGTTGGMVMFSAIPLIVIGEREGSSLRNSSVLHFETGRPKTRMRNAGIGMTIGGSALTTLSAIFFARNLSDWKEYGDGIYAHGWDYVKNEITGQIFTKKEFSEFERKAYEAQNRVIAWTVFGLAGGAATATGIPLWIIGNAETKRYKAMPTIHIAANGLTLQWNF